MAAADLPIVASASAQTGVQSPVQSNAGTKTGQSANVPTTVSGDTAHNNAAAEDGSTDFTEMLAEIMSAEAATLPVATPIVVAVANGEADDELDLQALDAASEMLKLANGMATPVAVLERPTNVQSGEQLDFTRLNAAPQTLALDSVLTLAADADKGKEAGGMQSPRGVGDFKTDMTAFANSIAGALPAHARAVEAAERPIIRAHVGTPAWTDEVSARLTYMVERGVQSASLQLSPEHLGPLEIRISIRNDQTTVWFGAAHAETRTALEQALPRLRELFAGQGLNLSDAGVFRESPQERAKYVPNNAVGRGVEREVAISAVAARGAVDAYA